MVGLGRKGYLHGKVGVGVVAVAVVAVVGGRDGYG